MRELEERAASQPDPDKPTKALFARRLGSSLALPLLVFGAVLTVIWSAALVASLWWLVSHISS